MSNRITVSAPGKLMLFGEHAVVYGRPCIVTAVGQRMRAKVELTDDAIFELNAPDVKVENYKRSLKPSPKGSGFKKPFGELGTGDIPKGAKFVEMAVRNFFTQNTFTAFSAGKSGDSSHSKSPLDSSPTQNDNWGVRVTTKSEFNSQFGFGSSSASTVCVIKALSELTKKKLSKRQIFDLSYKTVLDVQGKGSGFDVASAIYGGTLYFVKGGKVIKPLKITNLPLIVGYTGIKFDTVKLIDEVAQKAKKYPWIIDNVYTSIGQLVEQAKKAILKADFVTLGELMNFNEGYLATLGIEGKKLTDMIYAAREAGAYGAKLSGAGIGDCMIAIAPKDRVSAVKKSITDARGEVIDVETGVEGVRIESN